MENRISCLIFTLSCLYALAVSANAVGDLTFLSIDCGSTVGYTDKLGLIWETDENYIQTGEGIQIAAGGDISPVNTLRFFPEPRSRHCYVLPASAGTSYFLRVVLHPGNTSIGVELPVTFNVTVNSNPWFSYSATVEDDRKETVQEMLIWSPVSEIQVCLIKDEGFPFLSSLEMREVPDSVYSYMVANGKYFVLVTRANTGTPANEVVRFPDDRFDRYWWPLRTLPGQNITSVQNASIVLERPGDLDSYKSYNQPPLKVMQDGWVINEVVQRFQRPAELQSVYAAFYFQEIRPNVTESALLANPIVVRADLNGLFIDFNISTTRPMQPNFLLSYEGDTDIVLTASTISSPKRPGVLNGFEVYYAWDYLSISTMTKDVVTIKVVQQGLGLTSWTGDPCFPVPWDWITCDETRSIVKISLSHMNITGSIPEEIADLKKLTEIALDNNNITGLIPPLLSKLEHLKILALDNNNLHGSIPLALQNRTGFTFSGNPKLRCQVGDITCSSPPGSKSSSNAGVKNWAGQWCNLTCAVLATMAIEFLVLWRMTNE